MSPSRSSLTPVPISAFRRAWFPSLAWVAAGLIGSLPLGAKAQPSAPHIGYLYPAGGRQGTRFEVTVGGQFLDGVTNVYASGAGVRAVILQHEKPLTPAQANNLREEMKNLQEKRTSSAGSQRKRGNAESSTNVFTAEDQRMLLEIRKKLAAFVRRPASPAIAEKVSLEVTLAPDAEPGTRELRVSTPLGLSNPLAFCVGQLPEFREKVPPLDTPFGRNGKTGPRDGSEPRNAPPTDLVVTLPAVINGQILPGETDRYRFQARKGQRLLFAVSARELIPYLADAVPGWFQATLSLCDNKGKELAYDDDYRFHPDPVLFYTIPQDGDYAITIKDAIYRGREDFVYRITAGELPFITSGFPLGGRVGEKTTVELRGWNLETNQLVVEPQEARRQLLSAPRGEYRSNLIPFAAETLPECLEKEPNDSVAKAQPITLPVIINGHIDHPTDADFFQFEGRAGEAVVAEVCARRLDSPLDSVLRLTDAAGRELAYNDDHEDKGSGLDTHHADSYLSLTLPADGTYYLCLRDAQRAGGPEYGYRLRVSAPLPDFALRVVPSSITLRAGTTIPVSVYALRKDGFTNEIRLALKNAPPGFALNGALVPPGQDQVRLTLSGPASPRETPFHLALEGSALIQGHTVTRQAVPAEDMMQAFAYRHLVPAQEWEAAVIGRFRARAGFARIMDELPIKIPAGGTAHVQVSVPANTFFGKVELELSDPPEGIAMQRVAVANGTSELLLACDAAKIKPGTRGNLIVNAFVETSAANPNKKANANRRRAPAGSLPAIPYEITASGDP